MIGEDAGRSAEIAEPEGENVAEPGSEEPEYSLERRWRGASPGREADPRERRDSVRIASPPMYVGGLRAIVSDISAGGLCLVPAAPLRVGQRFRLTLTDGLSAVREELDAEVVWCAEGRAGLRWVELTPAQQQWLHERFEGWRSGSRFAWVDRGELYLYAT